MKMKIYKNEIKTYTDISNSSNSIIFYISTIEKTNWVYFSKICRIFVNEIALNETSSDKIILN
jgi:hypothetical protein